MTPSTKRTLSEGDGQPGKKKRRWRGNKKKKEGPGIKVVGDEVTYKPVLTVHKPEDYSANWKLGKEVT